MDLRLRLRQLRHLALDLDGTLHTDGAPLECARPFLATLEELGLGRSFVTNNCSRSPQDYVSLLRGMGIEANVEDIYSSSHATIAYLRRELPAVQRLFVLGTAALAREFESAGFSTAGDTPEDPPDAVVVGFDTGLVYERLCRAAYWIAAGKEFVATHPDRVCPTRRPTVLVDCGSVCAALEHATGRRPQAVLGKPDPRMLAGLMERHRLRADELAMVGDRLYTDIAMALSAGALGVLVLSGETKAEAVDVSPHRPDLIARDVGELAELLLEERGSRR